MVQLRALETAKGRFLFRVTPLAREFKRAIERHVVYPPANLLSPEQVPSRCDLNRLARAEAGQKFLREVEGALLDPHEILRFAHDSRYRAKANGRNRCELASLRGSGHSRRSDCRSRDFRSGVQA